MDKTKLRVGDPLVRRILDATWPEWSGRKVELVVADEYHLACYTSEGGTWNEWKALDLVRFKSMEIPTFGGLQAHVAGPGSLAWNVSFEASRVPTNVAYVGRIHFCGKDMGVRIVIHPDNAAKLLEGEE